MIIFTKNPNLFFFLGGGEGNGGRWTYRRTGQNQFALSTFFDGWLFWA